MLVALGLDLTAIKQQGSVVDYTVIEPRAADNDCRAALCGFSRQFLHRNHAVTGKTGAINQVFREVSGNRQFRRDDQIDLTRIAARLTQFFQIARQITHGRVQLGKGNGEAVCHGVSGLSSAVSVMPCSRGSRNSRPCLTRRVPP